MNSNCPRANTTKLALILVALFALLAPSCGGEERKPILINAKTVQGERVVFQDLAETDTVLWFWAPW